MEYGKYKGNFNHWIDKCDEVPNIGSYLSELSEHERKIFWHYLQNAIREMETERVFRKHFALTACDPKHRVNLEKESFRTEFQMQCESVFERWKEYKIEKSLRTKQTSDVVAEQKFLKILK
jgi:hypothetical protein